MPLPGKGLRLQQLTMHSWVKITDQLLDFTVSEFKETVKSPIQAAVEAVNDIVKNYPPPYNLFVSGGIDSQAMLYAWKISNQPFNAYTFRYNETYNVHDIQTLFLFCERENIPYTVVDFDYFKFLEEEYDSIAKKYNCSSPQISMHIKMATMFTGTNVFSGNFLLPNVAVLSYAILGIYRYSITTEGKNTIPYFFLHTPELAYSIKGFKQYNLDEINELERLGYQRKACEYNLVGFPVIPQEQKFTGFEKFKEHYDSHTYVLESLRNRLKFSDRPSRRPFDWLFRYPYEDLFNDRPLSHILNKPPYVIN
jgi:hypothetical protein